MIVIEKLKMELRSWRKEKVLKICEDYNIPIDDELKQKTKREIEHIIIERARDLNRIEEEQRLQIPEVKELLEDEETKQIINEVENISQEEVSNDVEENIIDEPLQEEVLIEEQEKQKVDEIIGKKFIRKDDESLNPSVFVCEVKDGNKYQFSFDGGKITMDDDMIQELLIPYDKNIIRKPKPSKEENTLFIQVPKSEDIKDKAIKESPKVIKVDMGHNKKEKSNPKPKNTEPVVGAGRGRLTAKILCFDSPERKTPIKEFETFADARIFLNVKSVGNSLERASETGKPSRGYWWIVQDISKPNDTKRKPAKTKEEPSTPVPQPMKQSKEEAPPQQITEQVIITPPVLEKKTKQVEEVDDESFFEGMLSIDNIIIK